MENINTPLLIYAYVALFALYFITRHQQQQGSDTRSAAKPVEYHFFYGLAGVLLAFALVNVMNGTAMDVFDVLLGIALVLTAAVGYALFRHRIGLGKAGKATVWLVTLPLVIIAYLLLQYFQ